MDLIKSLIESISVIAPWFSLIASVLGTVLAAAGAKKSFDLLFKNFIQVVGSVGEPDSEENEISPIKPKKDLLTDRLREVRSMLSSELGRLRIGKWSSWILTAGQVGVGALLTAGFAQQTLSPNVLGVCGLVVIICTGARIQFKPEVRAAAAKERVFILRTLIRQVEDELYKLDNNAENARSRTEILEFLTAGMNFVESLELKDFQKAMEHLEKSVGEGKKNTTPPKPKANKKPPAELPPTTD